MGINIYYLLLILSITYVSLVLYIRNGWNQLGRTRCISKKYSYPFVSILVAARNEENNIELTMDGLIYQLYPKDKMEIIVIDDHSTDRTADIVKSYANKGVKILQLQEGDKLNSYKKLAISKGIDLSKGEIIITTDADCQMNENWLTSIMEYMQDGDYDLVSSPVVYHREKSFFERLQTLEFLYLIGLGAGGIGNGYPTTCNGANLAYRKSTFFEVDGFRGIDDVASGDDELLLHKMAERNPDKVGFCKAEDAIVYTEAKPNLKYFISQRKRWASKSTKYKDKKVIILGIVIWLFNVVFMFSLLTFLIHLPHFDVLFLTCLGMKFFAELLFLFPIVQFARRPELILLLPILTVIHPIYFTYIGIAGNIGKYDWKGRTVK